MSPPIASASAGAPAVSPVPVVPSMIHQTRHGGVLAMPVANGVHLHVETMVEAEGRVSLWSTDPHGDAIAPNDVKGTVTCEREDTHAKTVVSVRVNLVNSAVEATCPALAAPTTSVTYELVIRGTPVMHTLHVPSTGTKPIPDGRPKPDPASHDHAH
jgi:hypothetical protein